MGLVKSGMHIVSGLGAAEGALFLGSLHKLAGKVTDVSVTTCLPMRQFEYMTDEKCVGTFNQDGWFFNSTLRKSFSLGNVSHVPQQLSTAAFKRMWHKNRISISAIVLCPTNTALFLSVCPTLTKIRYRKQRYRYTRSKPCGSSHVWRREFGSSRR